MTTIKRENYFTPGIYEAEVKAIFEKEWLFAGFTWDIPAKKDWFTLDLFGHSLIIYNTGSGIRAYQNVCPHRFNRILTEASGSGPIMCKYHLWAFNDKGELMGKKPVYPEPQQTICLKSYHVDTIGNFIFVNLSAAPAYSLQQQLGDEIQEQLLSLSQRMHRRIYQQTVPHNCNWKFIVENVIENQHCLAIHQNTLVKAGFCKAPPTVQSELSANSYFIIPLSSESAEKKRSFIVNHVFGKENVNNFYKHTYIYPNMVISDFEGINFNIARLVPSSGDHTDFQMQFFIAKPVSDNEALVNEYVDITIKFGRNVFEEDKAVLENLQNGVKQVGHDGYQYTTEQRVGWFIQSYNHSMNNNGVH